MTDVLIRSVHPTVLLRLDEIAKAAGVTRAEYLRNLLTAVAHPPRAQRR